MDPLQNGMCCEKYEKTRLLDGIKFYATKTQSHFRWGLWKVYEDPILPCFVPENAKF